MKNTHAKVQKLIDSDVDEPVNPVTTPPAPKKYKTNTAVQKLVHVYSEPELHVGRSC